MACKETFQSPPIRRFSMSVLDIKNVLKLCKKNLLLALVIWGINITQRKFVFVEIQIDQNDSSNLVFVSIFKGVI